MPGQRASRQPIRTLLGRAKGELAQLTHPAVLTVRRGPGRGNSQASRTRPEKVSDGNSRTQPEKASAYALSSSGDAGPLNPQPFTLPSAAATR